MNQTQPYFSIALKRNAATVGWYVADDREPVFDRAFAARYATRRSAQTDTDLINKLWNLARGERFVVVAPEAYASLPAIPSGDYLLKARVGKRGRVVAVGVIGRWAQRGTHAGVPCDELVEASARAKRGFDSILKQASDRAGTVALSKGKR